MYIDLTILLALGSFIVEIICFCLLFASQKKRKKQPVVPTARKVLFGFRVVLVLCFFVRILYHNAHHTVNLITLLIAWSDVIGFSYCIVQRDLTQTLVERTQSSLQKTGFVGSLLFCAIFGIIIFVMKELSHVQSEDASVVIVIVTTLS